MKFFINLSVKKKLVSVFSVICIFMVLIGTEGILSCAKINNSAKEMYSNNLISITDLEEIQGNINDMRANMLRIVFERDINKLDEQIKTIDDSAKENDNFMKEYENLPATSEEENIYTDFKDNLLKYRESRNKVIDLVKANNYDQAVKLYNSEVSQIRTTMFENLKKCIDINEKLAEQANLDNTAQFNSVRYTIIIYTAIAFLIILFMAYILSKNIMNPLKKIKDLAQRLSNYDFSIPITITRTTNLDKQE